MGAAVPAWGDLADHPGARVTIAPAWVHELLLAWARSDWSDRSIGWRAQASFERSDDDDPHREMLAIHAALDWLALAHPEHWRVAMRIYRPSAHRELVVRDGDALRAQELGTLLADYIDRVLG